MNKTYSPKLAQLEKMMEAQPDTPYLAWAKVVVNVCLKMQFDDMVFTRNLPKHPHLLLEGIIDNALAFFSALSGIAHIGVTEGLMHGASQKMEQMHQELFDDMWSKYSPAEFRQYIDRYVHRIRVNDLEPLLKGKRCLDMGCGNGVFCFAALEAGAAHAAGIDFGATSIAFAKQYAGERGWSGKTDFRCATVYDTGLPDDSCDFAINNGVFHHLEHPDQAIQETKRILVQGGWLWYYTEGEGAMAYELGDAQIRMLKALPPPFIEEVMVSMKINRNKIVHMMDAFNAIYAHTSWEKMTAQLAAHGFGDFRRLTGGMPTDFDLDVIEADPYGREKFGEGDLRILCQLKEK